MFCSRGARLLICMLWFASAWGCAGGSSGPGAAVPPVPPAKPTSPQEAIDRLSVSQKQAFEKWRGSIIKACDPAEIFALAAKSPDEPVFGVDLRVFLENNGESLLLRGPEGSFAIIDQGPAVAEPVVTSVNAEGVEATAAVDDTGCIVTLQGQKIFAGPFHESMNVIAFAEEGKTPRFFPGRISAQPTSDAALSRLAGVNPTASLASVFTPEEEAAVAWVAARLGLAHPRLADLVRAKPRRTPELSYRWSFNTQAYWFGAEETRPLEQAAVARALLEKLPAEARLFAVWELPARNFGGLRNLKDRGPHRFEAHVLLRGEGVFVEPWRESAAGFDGATELSRCLITRTTWLLGAEPSPTPATLVRPSLTGAADPCHVLDPESWKRWDAENVWASVLPAVLARVGAGPRTDYGGWEHPFFRLVTAIFDKGQDPLAVLDPRGKSAFLAGFVARIGELRARLAAEELAGLREWRSAYDRMVATWAFVGKNVSGARLDRILRATARAMPVLPASTTTLVAALGPAPEGFEDELEFAASLDAPYLSLATQLGWRADALDCGWFQEKVLDLIIQRKIPRAELERWNGLFAKLNGWSLRFPGLRQRQGSIGHIAIELLERGRTDAEVEKTLAALSNAVDPFDDSTAALIDALDTDPTGAVEELVFATELTPAYKAQAGRVRQRATELGLAAWAKDFWRSILQRRPSASQLEEFSRALEAGARFTARETERRQGHRENPQDRQRIELIVRAIDENWGDVEFGILEAVAPLAAFKEICHDRSALRTTAARADCLGLEFFHASPRKILWPSFAGRYRAFAEAVKAELDRHAAGEILRPELVTLFFARAEEPAWSLCEAGEYARRSGRAIELLVALRNEADSRQREPIRIAFRENLKNCTSPAPSAFGRRDPRSARGTLFPGFLPEGEALSAGCRAVRARNAGCTRLPDRISSPAARD